MLSSVAHSLPYTQLQIINVFLPLLLSPSHFYIFKEAEPESSSQGSNPTMNSAVREISTAQPKQHQPGSIEHTNNTQTAHPSSASADVHGRSVGEQGGENKEDVFAMESGRKTSSAARTENRVAVTLSSRNMFDLINK